MTTVKTLKERILRNLRDESQTNYTDTELYDYFNEALDCLSREIGKFQHSIGIKNTTLTYGEAVYFSDLPDGFLHLAKNNEGDERVFNTDQDYARLCKAEAWQVDRWEDEDEEDTGIPNLFYFRGNQLLIHPRPEEQTNIKIYYFGLEEISGDENDIPWNGIFDRPIEKFVKRACHTRSEMFGYTQADMFDYETLKSEAHAVMFRRDGAPSMRPAFGWDN